MTKEEIGRILKKARENKGMTQLQVAEKIGKRQQTICNWESGCSQPDANTLFTLCNLYGISIDDTFGGGQHVIVSSSEKRHIDIYRSLDDHGKRIVDLVIKEEAARMAAGSSSFSMAEQSEIARDRYGSALKSSSLEYPSDLKEAE